MSNPLLEPIDIALLSRNTIGDQRADVDFQRFKAFDEKTGAQIAEFQRVEAFKWKWQFISKNKNTDMADCPEYISVALEERYISWLSKQIVNES